MSGIPLPEDAARDRILAATEFLDPSMLAIVLLYTMRNQLTISFVV